MTTTRRTSFALVATVTLFLASVATFVQQQRADAGTSPREQIAKQHAKSASSRTMVRIAAGAFDPAKGVPEVPADLQAAATRYWFVQVHAPATKPVRVAIEAAGAEILGTVPDVTYLVRADAAAAAKVTAVQGVRWVGMFQPAWKVAPGIDKIGEAEQVRVWAHRGLTGKAIAPTLARIPGVKVTEVSGTVAVVDATKAALSAIARVDDVVWVEPQPQYELHNGNALWVTDTGERDKLAATAPGRLTGTGQTAAVADTGVNYKPDDNGNAQRAFSDCNAAAQCKLADYVQTTAGNSEEAMGTVAPTGHSHRKMSGYFNLAEDDPNARSLEGSWHGTHVAGSVAADYPDANGNYGTRTREADGIAVGARLSFQDIEAGGGLSGLPGDQALLYDQVYDLDGDNQYDPLEDARTHNNSYGSIISQVDTGDGYTTDVFAHEHPDMMIVFSAANSGPRAATLAGGAQESKNVITSCASANGRQPMVSPDSVASFSSHGPSLDGRLKPDVCTPGQINVSPKGGTVDEDHYLQGTSMSGPMLVGLVTLVREYFWEGWGPDAGTGFAVGTKDVARRHNPSSALVKAVTINSAQRMRGFYTGDEGSDRSQDGMWPSSGQGWGKVELDQSLYFAGDDRTLYTVDRPNDDESGLETGQEVTQFIDVAPGQPLNVHLTWIDPPSLQPAGTPTLVNNLDLEVTAPDGSTYLGNETTTQTPTFGQPGNPAAEVGESKTGGVADVTNNVEGVRLAAPAPGRYEVTVKASDIPEGPQGYALAVSGRLATTTPRIVFDAPKYKPGATATAWLLGTGLSGDTIGGFTREGPSVYKQEIVASGTAVVAEGGGVRATAPVDSTAPEVTNLHLDTVAGDLTRFTWTTDEISTSAVTVTGPDGDATFVDVYNTDTFPGMNATQIETKGVYLNRKVVTRNHEVNVTGLKAGTPYTYRITSADEAGNEASGSSGEFTSTDAMYQPKAPDMAMLLSGELNAGIPAIPDVQGQGWGTSTQLYAGSFEPTAAGVVPALHETPVGSVKAVPAFMFRLPASVDPARITGAAVEMYSAHDIHDVYTTETTFSMDLLDSGAEARWGPGKTYTEVATAAADVQLAPDMTLRRGANTKYAWHVPCNQLDAFKTNLSEDTGEERRAAFRLSGITEQAEALFSFEMGYNRRSRGPHLRPRLVLFMDGLDPQPCTATAAPKVSDVRVDHTDDTSAVVSWRTDVASDSTVYFREAGTSEWTPVSAPVRVTQHFIRVEGLEENGAYEFVVRSATCNGLATVDDNGGDSYALYNDAFVPPQISGVHAKPSPDDPATELIGWFTNQEADSIVRYGTSPTDLSNEVKLDEFTDTHEVALPDLSPCTRYYFTVTSTNGAGKPATSPVMAFDRPTADFSIVRAWDFEADEGGWVNDPEGGSGNLGLIVDNVETNKTIWERRAAETGSQAMRTVVAETGTPGYTSNVDLRLVSPPVTMPAGYSVLEWTEWYNLEGAQPALEAWEQPRVEISVDNGATWIVLREGVESQTPSFPLPDTIRLPLPEAAAGRDILVSFRLKTDTNSEPPTGGWAVDDVEVLNGNCETLAGVVAGVPVAPSSPPQNLSLTAQRVAVGPLVPVDGSGDPIGALPALTGAPSQASLDAGTCRCGDVRFLGAVTQTTGSGGGGGGTTTSNVSKQPAATLAATGGNAGLLGFAMLALAWLAVTLRRRLTT
ncbi:MAG TPA: S8 family serine peptidase [Acidimicrobiales bacterium]|nr:S8 family serine peptidase [Acidimicrobiales bacterium]